MNTTRSVAELSQAARDAGFDGDPLTEEILRKLAELDARHVQPVRTSAPPATMIVSMFALAACVGCAGWFFGQKHGTESARTAAAQVLESTIASKDTEISAAKTAANAQIAAVSDKLQRALAEVQTLSERNATVASSNTTMAQIYTVEVKSLIEELRRLREDQTNRSAK